MVTILEGLGVPLGVAFVVLVFWFVFKESFRKFLNGVATRESLKVQAAYDQALEDRKAELAKETERLKIQLSVRAETRRMAARERFETLMKLWRASESLIIVLEYGSAYADKAIIQRSLEGAWKCFEMIQSSSVLYSAKLLEDLRQYVGKVYMALRDLSSSTPIEESSEGSVNGGGVPKALWMFLCQFRVTLGECPLTELTGPR